MTAWDLICSDLARAAGTEDPRGILGRLRLVTGTACKVRSVAIIGYRFAHAAGKRSPLTGALVKAVTHVITGADIDYRATIGPGLLMMHPTGIVIADSARVGARCSIYHGVTLGSHPAGSVTIGDDVFIGPGAKLVHPVTIADRVKIGANAVVTHSIDLPGVTVVGAPARILDRDVRRVAPARPIPAEPDPAAAGRNDLRGRPADQGT